MAEICTINNPSDRLYAVFESAVKVFGDEEAASEFMTEGHGGLVARDMGREGDYIFPDLEVKNGGDGTRIVVQYLYGHGIRQRVNRLFEGCENGIGAFMRQPHEKFGGLSPAEANQSEEAYKQSIAALDEGEAKF